MKLTTTTALTLLSATTTLARPHPTEERDIDGEAAWNDAPAATATSDVPVIAADKRQDDSWMSGWYEYNTATLLTGPTNVDIFGMPIAKRTDAPAVSAVPSVPADKRDDNAWMSGWYEYNTATLLTGPTNVDVFGMPKATKRAEAVEEKRDFHDSHGQNLRPANHEAPGLDPYGPQTTQNVGRVATRV